MKVTDDMNVYGTPSWLFLQEHKLRKVSFDMELIDSKYYLYFNICCGKFKYPHTLMFWQNLDRLRHKMEECAYVPHYEWVRIPFSDGYCDPINTLSLKFYEEGKVLVYFDCENRDSYIFVCDVHDVIEKLYTNLLKWTQLYDESEINEKGNENFYSKKSAYEHLKSPILEEYIQDIKRNNNIWRHNPSVPGLEEFN